ncbi:plastid division protein PDV2 isoform X1 [Solanum dulcamara]|uniref:plastid division protein PDV2 isoform X1 n=1 Tax=Solanum dulcamara TaxID=45834 RepID=UPI0024860886|nr:plastid division protein PDV2 isoform X1 [Solanum dulcamara]
MDEDRIGLVLARISELRLEITSCIHKASKKDEVESENREDAEDGKTHEDDDEAVDCLLKIKDALESLEAQVSSLQEAVGCDVLQRAKFWILQTFDPMITTVNPGPVIAMPFISFRELPLNKHNLCEEALQEQQWYEKEAALAEIGYSQEKLLQTLKGYEGKDYQVIHEAIAFVSETVEDNNDLLLPPYPSRPSRTVVSDKGYGVHLPSTRKLTQNGVTGSHNHNSRKDVDEANRKSSQSKSPLSMVKFFISAAAKTALTVVGVISVLSLAGFEPQLKKRDNQIKVSNLFQQLANRKVPVVENGETQCVVKERVEIPFESVVATPDVNYGCG